MKYLKPCFTLSTPLLVALFLLSPIWLDSQEPPEWLFDVSGVYPEEIYLSAVGSGSSRKAAEEDALRQLAQRFSVQIASEATSLFQFEDSAGGEQSRRSVEQRTQTTVDQTLQFVEIGDPYRDSDGLVHIVAVIERQQAAIEIVGGLDRLVGEMNAFVELAEQPDIHPIERYAHLSAAIDKSEQAQDLLLRYIVVEPNRAKQRLYRQRTDATSLYSERVRVAGAIEIGIAIDGDSDGTAADGFRTVLTRQGFSTSDGGATHLEGVLDLEESDEHPRYATMIWNLSARLSNAEGRSLFNFVASGRNRGINSSAAMRQARLDISTAIEEDFIAELRQSLGRGN